MYKCVKKCMCYLFYLFIFVEIIIYEFDVGKKLFFFLNICEENFVKVFSKKFE